MIGFHRRTWEEVMESPRYGKLWKVIGIHGNRIRCNRLRVRENKLYEDTGEKITLIKGEQSKLSIALGDLAFVDNGSKVWSLWKITKEDET